MIRTEQAVVTAGRAEARTPWRDFAIAGGAGLVLVLLGVVAEHAAILHPARIVFGLAFVLYVPGYLLVAAIFPRTDDLDGPERLGLRLGLSVASIALLALVIDRLPWGLGMVPIFGGTLILTATLSAVAYWRRSRLPAELRGDPGRISWPTLPPSERRIYRGLGVGAVLIGLLSAWILLVPTPDRYMTEFYMLGPGDRAERYPYQARQGEPIGITIGIANHERTAAAYAVEVWVSDQRDPSRRTQVLASDPVSLDVGERYRAPLTWVMPAIGADQLVEIILYRDGDAEPYRLLRAWVDVRP
jgi:uncharacterized membrane protein